MERLGFQYTTDIILEDGGGAVRALRPWSAFLSAIRPDTSCNGAHDGRLAGPLPPASTGR